jgi:hypothetical protein
MSVQWYLRISDGEATETRVVDLEKLCNFVVDNLFIWNHLYNKNYVWFLKFKIWIFQITSDGETPKAKVVDLEKSCNFAVGNFFIWNHLAKENYGWIFSNLKLKFLKWPRMEKWTKSKLWISKSYKTL